VNSVFANKSMSDVPQVRLVWSDAWLLVAVLGCGAEGGELHEVICYGDVVNHAIFLHCELQGGFARLAAAGLIEKVGDRYQAKSAAQRLTEFSDYRRAGLFTQVDVMQKRLARLKIPGNVAACDLGPTQTEFDLAIERYLGTSE
jgi:hypothetical protein